MDMKLMGLKKKKLNGITEEDKLFLFSEFLIASFLGDLYVFHFLYNSQYYSRYFHHQSLIHSPY